MVLSDSTRSSKSSKSVTSPPPKKHEKDLKHKENQKKQETPAKKQENDTKSEETTLPKENMMDTEETQANPEKCREVEEDLRSAKLDIVTLKRENIQLRHINKTQIELNSKAMKHIESERSKCLAMNITKPCKRYPGL